MADNPKKPIYKVGYGKTPEHTRFKPGQSGNPKGKPKGAKNLTTVVSNAISGKVIVTENGKRKRVSKLEVAVMLLVNKAASGDHKAMQQLLPLVQLIEGRAAIDTGSAPVLAEADNLVMDSINKRFKQSALHELSEKSKPTTTAKPNKEKKS